MKIHDPMNVAHVAATMLAGRHDAEPHHIKAAVAAAKGLLDEAYRSADEDEARVDAAHAEASVAKEEKREGQGA